MTNIFRKTYGTRARGDNYFHKKREVSAFSTLCLPETKKTLDNQTIIKRFAYPEPGSNRHGLPHWCLRPARLPIPPSGLLLWPRLGLKAVQRYAFIEECPNYFSKKLTSGGQIDDSATFWTMILIKEKHELPWINHKFSKDHSWIIRE